MRRIYPAFAYSDAPRANCWWDQTCELPRRPSLQSAQRCDVAIIGAGFTGLSAALHLAEAGVSVMVLESRHVGWGASGRNGGFCCLGGGMLPNSALERKYGYEGRRDWRQAEIDAVRLVEEIIDRHGIEVDRHSTGETQLAHRPSDFSELQRSIGRIEEDYGVSPALIARTELSDHGMSSDFHGALTLPIGFALNPRKYVNGLAKAAEASGAVVFHDTSVTEICRRDGGYLLRSPTAELRVEKVIIATNGYSSEDLPPWFAGRYMPTQSSIIVTRPLSHSELSAQGWTTPQACYDTRHLLHYFRLMPDRRMLFGVRGGLLANRASERRALQRARHDFDEMFPAWENVETPHGWSGMVCIARDRMPFVGTVPREPDMYVGLCYHGNGVAMASYSGALLADLVLGQKTDRTYPAAMRSPLRQFEMGRFRRALMPFAYAGFALADR
ncbi:FAD-dependent oxidoreductase [Sulfitobacter aestuarii]|uniref:FAD-dependent oxidoreductase n=1 Tax=Sulfitobacter aestuarii TaxID=2161676 RepID=A0ABW5U619_9RHOB